jgi:hypothetical protein
MGNFCFQCADTEQSSRVSTYDSGKVAAGACGSRVQWYNIGKDAATGKMNHDLIKLLLELSDIDQMPSYLNQENEAESLKSFDNNCNDEHDVEFWFGLSLSRSFMHGLQQKNTSTKGVHKIDEHGILDSDCNQSPGNFIQSKFSNILNNSTESIHMISCNFHEAGRHCYTNLGHELIQS